MRTNTIVTALAVGWICANACGKRIVCIDPMPPGGDSFLAGKEGYHRQNAEPGDVIDISGNLAACINMVVEGDTLVIVAHGAMNGGGFFWQGQLYTGFVGGADQGSNPYPVPGYMAVKDLTIDLCICWSARDPDGPGGSVPLTTAAERALTITGLPPTPAAGFTDTATSGSRPCLFHPENDQDALDAAAQCLIDTANQWAVCPPANRPGEPNNQRAKAIAILMNCKGAEGVTIPAVKYDEPTNTQLQGPTPPFVVLGCACQTLPGCGFTLVTVQFETAAPIPTVGQWGMIVLSILLAIAATIAVATGRRPSTA